MNQKRYFLLDRNYLLKSAQADAKDELLAFLIDEVKKSYFLHYNSLQLIDSQTEIVQNYQYQDNKILTTFYNKLSAIYRYQNGSTQLELLFSSTDHYTHYSNLWTAQAKKIFVKFCLDKMFVSTILKVTVFGKNSHIEQPLSNWLQRFLCQKFSVKFVKKKGRVNVV